jgi:hypothetical protein
LVPPEGSAWPDRIAHVACEIGVERQLSGNWNIDPTGKDGRISD